MKWIMLAAAVWVTSVQVGGCGEYRSGSAGFKVLIWPYGTNVQKDLYLYKALGLGGFQIDKGQGKHRQIRMSTEKDFPFYGGHVANKGYLHLKEKNRALVTRKREVLKRPLPLSDPSVIRAMKNEIRKNVSALRNGNVIAYALDDEPSLGAFVNPADVDASHFSVVGFQNWLKQQYKNLKALNAQWGTGFISFENIQPMGFEQVRQGLSHRKFSGWNLSAWMDFREYMDIQFSAVLSELVAYANGIDPFTPAGIVGGQAPGPWGGYDYGRLARAVQWIEAYDIHATNEIMRSFWRSPKRIRMQTFFSRKDWKLDSWFLWYYMLHGNQAAIAWPEGWFETKQGIKSPVGYIKELTPVFKEVQGRISEIIVDQNTLFSPDPVGIYYSHPSIRAGWVMDALVHGKPWPNRLSSIDNENQSAGVLRKAGCKLLEDLGFQYDFINYLDVKDAKINLNEKFKLIILPKIVCLSHEETLALKRFVMNGGVLVADHLCGVLDEHGKWRGKGALDDLFGVDRNDGPGYLNGKGLTEINAEKYNAPFNERFTYYNGAFEQNGLVIFERGTKRAKPGIQTGVKKPDCLVKNQAGKGWTCYLNLSPIRYWHSSTRCSENGKTWRIMIQSILSSSGLAARVKVAADDECPTLEPLFWKSGKDTYLGIIKNPSDDYESIREKPGEIALNFAETTTLVNLHTGKKFQGEKEYRDIFYPWKGNVYRLSN